MLACAFQQLPFLSIQKPGLTYVREDHAVVQAVKRRKKVTINEQIAKVAEVSLSEEHIISDSFWQRRKTGVQRTLGGNVSRARSAQRVIPYDGHEHMNKMLRAAFSCCLALST